MLMTFITIAGLALMTLSILGFIHNAVRKQCGQISRFGDSGHAHDGSLSVAGRRRTMSRVAAPALPAVTRSPPGGGPGTLW